MPLPLTVSCFSKIQIGLTFLVPAHLGSPGKGPLNGCVCVCVLSGVKMFLSSAYLTAAAYGFMRLIPKLSAFQSVSCCMLLLCCLYIQCYQVSCTG